MRNLFLSCILFSFCSSALAVKVTVSAPAANATVNSPMQVTASATGSRRITGWVVYIDSKAAFKTTNATINTKVPITVGPHQVVIRAWDAGGAFDSLSTRVVVEKPAEPILPTPPDDAKVFTNIEELTKWSHCNEPKCAGGSGSGSYWMALNQTAPSLDGNSMDLYNSGIWANALFIQKLGSHNSVRNLLWDFYFYLDENAAKSSQALEFDAFQFVDGYNYMIGTQCNNGYGIWDTWDELNGHWIHSAIPCPKFSTNTWHHIQWYLQTMPETHEYKYVTLVVDGKAISFNIVQKAKDVGWSNNLGVQWQIDVNAKGIGYHEWVDKAKLTVW